MALKIVAALLVMALSLMACGTAASAPPAGVSQTDWDNWRQLSEEEQKQACDVLRSYTYLEVSAVRRALSAGDPLPARPAEPAESQDLRILCQVPAPDYGDVRARWVRQQAAERAEASLAVTAIPSTPVAAATRDVPAPDSVEVKGITLPCRDVASAYVQMARRTGKDGGLMHTATMMRIVSRFNAHFSVDDAEQALVRCQCFHPNDCKPLERVPGPPATPAPTSTPMPTLTPMPTPTPQPAPVDLGSATEADFWIYVRNGVFGRLDASSATDFKREQAHFFVSVDGVECANSLEWQNGKALPLGCGRRGNTPHADVQTVSVRIARNDGKPSDAFREIRCERNVASTSDFSAFACAWR